VQQHGKTVPLGQAAEHRHPERGRDLLKIVEDDQRGRLALQHMQQRERVAGCAAQKVHLPAARRGRLARVVGHEHGQDVRPRRQRGVHRIHHLAALHLWMSQIGPVQLPGIIKAASKRGRGVDEDPQGK
jgi:hypothetical protein